MDTSGVKNRLVTIAAFLLFYSQIAYAACGGSIGTELNEVNAGLRLVAAALGTLMLAILGVKWIMSDNPQERDDAKKGIIYVIVGLLLVSIASTLVDEIYCANIPV